MNYLAHLLLADLTSTSLVGSLLGDFLKNSELTNLEETLLDGIKLHKRIDCFTDSHQRVVACRKFIRPEYRKFSGILIDLFFDHFLSIHWKSFCNRELKAFVNDTYIQMKEHRLLLAGDKLIRYDEIISLNILESYKEIDGITDALIRLSKRLSRQNTLYYCVKDLQLSYQDFETSFLDFFPEAILFSKKNVS